MDLRQLRVVVAVAEEASFTRAAQRLGVAQSAVSTTVRVLERELGVALFERTTHRVSLTDAGRALLPEARAALAAVDAARDAVDEVRGGLRGIVQIGTMQAQAMRSFSIPALVADLRRHHPAVEIRLRQGSSAEMAEAVRDGSLDIAFVALGERPPAGVALQELTAERMQLALAEQHPLGGRAAIDLAGLAQATFVDFPQGWGTRLAVDRAFGADGIRRSVTFEVNDTGSVIEFVRHGLAVAILPPSLVEDVRGVAFRPVRRAPVFRISVAQPTNRRLSAASAAFLETLGAHVSATPS